MQASNSDMFVPIFRKAKSGNTNGKKKEHKAAHDFREKRRNRHTS